MASFVISNYMPNPIRNSATFITDTAQLPLPLKPNHQMFITTTSTPCSKLSTSTNLASVWRQVQGSNNWENLVEPLQPLLRDEIIRYGEFVTACYKAFDLDSSSDRYLSCKYGKRSMFQEVGLPDSGYEVTKYIYATAPELGIPMQPGSGSVARWVGYVAVSTDKDTLKRLGRRDVLIAFRGTVTNPEWIANLMSSLTPANLDPLDLRPDVKVESGFLSLYTSDESSATKFGVGSCREQLLCEVSRLINIYRGEELSLTLAGHSMGSSLALLLAYDISELGLNKGRKEEIPVTVFSFGGPRVGNLAFKERCDELGVKVLRIVNVNDPITKLPGVFFNEHFKVNFPRRFCPCYAHVGVELLLDFFKMHNPSYVHDLESYIGLLRSCSGIVQNKVKKDVSFSLMDRAKWLVFSTTTALNLDDVQFANAAATVMVNLVMFMCI